MAESFGTRLRLQREQQQISLTSIVEQTKIKLALLQGLERDDVSHWPEGIFRRAFVRAYARIIGLDGDSIVQEFVRLYPDSVDMSSADPVTPSGTASEGQRPPTRLWCLLSSAVPSRHRLRSDAVQKPDAAQRPESPVANEAGTNPRSEESPRPMGPDLAAAAHLCTELGRVLEGHEVPPLLERAAKVLDAVGLVVWIRNPLGTALTAALASGYSDTALAHLPSVKCDTDNATATAFRSAQPRIVPGNNRANGAVVVPLITPNGCVGVLAAELRHGGEQSESVRALVTIFAAQLATLVGYSPLAEAVNA